MSARPPRVGAILVATDAAVRVLVVRQGGGPFAGEWVLPGGGVETGETVEDAVRREVREETGLEARDLRRIARYEVRVRGPRPYHLHVHLLSGTVRGEARAEEGSAVRWARPDEVADHPVMARQLADAGLIEAPRAALRERARARGISMLDLGLTEDDRAWYEEVRDGLEASYLSAGDAAAQSGKSGGLAAWERCRRVVADAIDRDGAFLDVGCANGLLMESVARWARERGHAIEPYGLDLSPRLADLARARLPRWADRVYVGNVVDWRPPRRFDLVRTELEYVPRYRAPDLVRRLLADVVAPDGRLIVASYGSGVAEDVGETLIGWGFAVRGRSESTNERGEICARVAWIDARAPFVSD